MNEENRTQKLLEMREEEKKPFWTPERKKETREWVVSILTALVAVVLIRSFLFTMIRVEGESMLDTLQNGDRLFVSVLDVKIKGVDKGDVVICHYPGRGRTNFVKRVIATEGDTVEVSQGVVYVNGEAREEAYITPARNNPNSPLNNCGPWEVPEGCVFVMGDNRANSTDSRSVGPLSEEMIVGKVRFVWWPFTAMRAVS